MHLTNAVTYTFVPGLALASVARRARAASATIFLTVIPHGGQHTARRNALASVRADVRAARDRAAVATLVPPTPMLEPIKDYAAV